jgi:hypothetical protein
VCSKYCTLIVCSNLCHLHHSIRHTADRAEILQEEARSKSTARQNLDVALPPKPDVRHKIRLARIRLRQPVPVLRSRPLQPLLRLPGAPAKQSYAATTPSRTGSSCTTTGSSLAASPPGCFAACRPWTAKSPPFRLEKKRITQRKIHSKQLKQIPKLLPFDFVDFQKSFFENQRPTVRYATRSLIGTM